MTDNKIIKSLVSCIEGYCPSCLYGNTDQRHCKDDLMTNALDLINRLQAEKTALVEHLKKSRRQLKTTNKKTTTTILHLQTVLAEQKAENESLQAENERLQSINDSFTDIGKLYSEIKAEAYKEFANWQEIKLANNPNISSVALQSIIATNDNLVKEMVGEDG